MALTVRIVTAFPRRDTTPVSILWEGVVEVQNPDRIVPPGQPGEGHPERVIKGQVKLVQGPTGRFVGTPSRKTPDGRYFNYYDLGPALQKVILPAIEAALDGQDDESDLTGAAEDAFADLAF